MIDIIKENIWIYLLAINVLTFISFWLDKRLSGRSTRRISEASLLVLCLFGGTAGGWVASRKFRHKTYKRTFRAKFAIVVFIQVVVLIILFLRVYMGIYI
jgi:uncharacterized membrane protein YsdA (DUF1294 family)